MAYFAAPDAWAQVPAHAQAFVNDSRSHGTVGDAFLSFNEAIQLNNYTLTFAQLSAAEQGQIYGLGDVAFVDIDFAATPKITLERELDVIRDSYHGFLVVGLNGRPTIELGTTNGIVSTSNWSDFRKLHLRGGKTGLTITQSDTIYGVLLEDVTFEGQTVAGVRFVFPTDAGNTRIQVDRCRFVNLPQAIVFDDTGGSRNGTFFMADVSIAGGQNGILFNLGPGGGLNSILLERIEIGGTADAIRFVRRTSLDDRAVLLEARHMRITGGADAFTLSGSPTGQCQFLIQSSEFAGSRTSLTLGPPGANLDATVEETRATGAVSLAAARAGKLTLANARFSAATLDLASEGSPLLVTDSILDGVTTRLLGTTPARIEESRFVSGSLAGAPGVPLTVHRCHVAGTAIGNDVNVVSARTAPQLGSCDATPLDPPIGGNLALLADLPPNLTGIWFFGATAYYPTIGPRPFHFYMDVVRIMLVPGTVRGNARINIPIPNDPPLRGADLFFQMAVVPDLQFDAPPIALPPGRRIVIR